MFEGEKVCDENVMKYIFPYLIYNQTSGFDHLLQASTSPLRTIFQYTTSFRVKSLYLEPLVSDRLS